VKAAVGDLPTHNPSDETYWASGLRGNLTSRSYGEGLETGRAMTQAPRQSLTRQTTNRRAVCGRTACTVRRAGRARALSDPYQQALCHQSDVLCWLYGLVCSRGATTPNVTDTARRRLTPVPGARRTGAHDNGSRPAQSVVR